MIHPNHLRKHEELLSREELRRFVTLLRLGGQLIQEIAITKVSLGDGREQLLNWKQGEELFQTLCNITAGLKRDNRNETEKKVKSFLHSCNSVLQAIEAQNLRDKEHEILRLKAALRPETERTAISVSENVNHQQERGEDS